MGRPSTYAATIETLKTREYAKTEKKKLIPLERGILVCDWLVKKLDSLFSVGYTAKMEAELDKVESDGEPMNQMLSEFYAKFQKEVADCIEPPPDRSKFDFVFGLLSQVKEWMPAKKVGKRVYDDRAFVESVRQQADEGNRPLSARQLEFLIKMAVQYADQIPDCESQLREAGLGAGAVAAQKADATLVRYCFETMDRIGGMMENPFYKSVREQFENGRGLSLRQFGILAKAVGENAVGLADCEQIRAKLLEFVPGGFVETTSDPMIPGLLSLFDDMTKWRPPIKRGKKTYDDKMFMKSLSDQFARRHSLSTRQVAALKRVIAAYKEKIPNYAARAAAIGLEPGNGGQS